MGVRTRNNKKVTISSNTSTTPKQPSRSSHASQLDEDVEQIDQQENDVRSSSPGNKKGKTESPKISEQKVYEVEFILGKKYDLEGNISYLVKWKSWDGEPTWEPEEYCLCTNLLTEYEAKIALFQDQKKKMKKVRKSLSNSKKKATTMGIKRNTRNKRLI